MNKDAATTAFCAAAIIGLIAGGIYMDRHPDNAEIEKVLEDKGYNSIEITELGAKERFMNIFGDYPLGISTQDSRKCYK